MSSPPARWSPLTCLPSASLTPSGLIRLDSSDGEVEILSLDGLDLRAAENAGPMRRTDGGPDASSGASWIDRDEGLRLTLTTHRIFILPGLSGGGGEGDAGGRFVHLSAVSSSSPEGGPTMWTPKTKYKLLLSTYSYGELLIVFPLSSRGKSDRDDLLAAIRRATERKAWEEAARAQQRKKDSSAAKIAARKVGVDAILTKNALKHKEAAKLTDDAFGSGDVETLMREAGELVAIIKRYAATLERSKLEGKEDEGDEADANRLAGMLDDMGMTSGLTKEQMVRGGGKAAYYQTLARQLSDFLRRRDRLKDAGGMMTLTDVYCLFNRARGTNMISPEDLLKALNWMGELGLGIRSREFPSGLVVVQEEGFDDEIVAKSLVKLADAAGKDGKGITVLDASRSLHASAILANEQLLSAERLGYLCRDVTLEGIMFYRNRFGTDEFMGW